MHDIGLCVWSTAGNRGCHETDADGNPQEVSLLDVRKEINFCAKTKIPLLVPPPPSDSRLARGSLRSSPSIRLIVGRSIIIVARCGRSDSSSVGRSAAIVAGCGGEHVRFLLPDLRDHLRDLRANLRRG